MDRYRAVEGVSYPAPESLPAIRAAGGLSKLTPEARAAVRLVRREPGDICLDVPEESVPWLLEQGVIAPLPSGEEV